MGKILKVQQPDIHRKLRQQTNRKKRRRGSKEHLSFSDVLNLMKHSSYKRGKGGAIRQVR